MTKGCEQFYKALAERESSNRHYIINKSGFLGLYQMGELALIDIGYYFKDGTRENDWKGEWIGKDGIKSREDFLNNAAIQTKAVREYHAIIFHNYLKPVHHMIGGYKDGIKLTESGMIAAAHLGGQGAFQKWLNGEILEEKCIDGNGVFCSEYLKLFASHAIDCIPDQKAVNKIIKIRGAAEAAKKLKADAWGEFDKKLIDSYQASFADFKKEVLKAKQPGIDAAEAALKNMFHKECTALLQSTFQSSEFKCGAIHPKYAEIDKRIKAEGEDLKDKFDAEIRAILAQKDEDYKKEIDTQRTEKRAELRTELDAQIKLAYLAEGITLQGEWINADL